MSSFVLRMQLSLSVNRVYYCYGSKKNVFLRVKNQKWKKSCILYKLDGIKWQLKHCLMVWLIVVIVIFVLRSFFCFRFTWGNCDSETSYSAFLLVIQSPQIIGRTMLPSILIDGLCVAITIRQASSLFAVSLVFFVASFLFRFDVSPMFWYLFLRLSVLLNE